MRKKKFSTGFYRSGAAFKFQHQAAVDSDSHLT